MDWKEYQKHLVGELFWECHGGTPNAGEGRKRCLRFRKKWSYKHRQIGWGPLKAFCLESASRNAAGTLGADKNTACKHYMKFRERLKRLAYKEREKLPGEIELDESCFGGKRKGRRGRGSAGKVKVSGLLERKGRVCAVSVGDVSKETLMKEIEERAEKGSVFW